MSLSGVFIATAPRRKEFYNAINIGWSPKDPIFQSEGVGEALASDQLVSYTTLVSYLLK